MDNFESVKKEISEKERISMLHREEKQRASFAALKDILQLIDLTNAKTQTYTTYSRNSLRTYLKNPASESNQKQLRKLSEFLYTVSHVYRRIVNNKANQLTCKNWIVYPKMNDNGDFDENSYQNYIKTTKYIENMNLESQIRKCMVKAWLDDVVYGFTYGNPEDGEFMIHLLNPDYCKISSQHYFGGQLNFAFDFSFFNGSNSFYLDVYDPIFKKMYNKYNSDSSLRWQELPVERTFCIKINDDNLDYPVPPFSGMFDSLINLVDLQGVQDLKDELSAYKLIWAKIDTIAGTKEVDNFAIDLELANEFYQKMQEALPDNVFMALSPMDLDSIDFVSNTAEDTNIINKAYMNLVEANGDIVSNSNKITNSTSFKLALLADSMSAMAPVKQINTWVNLYVRNNLKIEDVIVEYSDVSKYFEEDRLNLLLKIAQYGVPVKQELASLVGLNSAKCRSMEFLEEKLGLSKAVWINPLVSSNTQSGISENGDGSEGRPIKDSGDLSDEGESTRDSNKNSN